MRPFARRVPKPHQPLNGPARAARRPITLNPPPQDPLKDPIWTEQLEQRNPMRGSLCAYLAADELCHERWHMALLRPPHDRQNQPRLA
jgi:hypothetical protein